MGVRGLLSYCRPIQRHLKDPGNLRLGVDAFCILYLFKENKAGLEEYLKSLVLKGHSLTIVIDGRAPKEKRETIEQRAAQREAAAQEADDLTTFTQSEHFTELTEDQQRVLKKELDKHKKSAWSLSGEHVRWFRGVCEGLGGSATAATVQVKWAGAEADEELAAGDFDAVISGDSDLLLHGVRRLWIPFGSQAVKHSEIIGQEFKRMIGLEGDRLYELAYLAGCDVQPVSLAPIKIAISWLRFYGSLEAVAKRFPDKVSQANVEEYKRLKESVWASK